MSSFWVATLAFSIGVTGLVVLLYKFQDDIGW